MKNVNQDYSDDVTSYIGINDVLQVLIMDDPDPTTYHSRINDMAEGKLVIAWPTNRGIRMLVHRDQILDFTFVRDGTPYAFTGLVDETNLAPMPEITVILSSSVIHVQRRENYRIKCLIPIEIHGTLKDNSHHQADEILAIRTSTYDISASGISIRYSKLIPEGTQLDIKLALPDRGPAIKVPCRVVYSESLTDNLMLYRTGIHYLSISEWERARIVRFIYRTQLKGLR